MDPRLASVLLVFAIACGGGKQSAPPAAPSNNVIAEATPVSSSSSSSSTTTPAPTAPATHPDGRPGVVSDEMVAVAEEMVTIIERMGADIVAAGTDCVMGAAAIRNGTQRLQPIALRAKAFEEEMKSPEAEAWFKARYMDRLVRAMGGMMQIAQTCATDKDFNAAAQEMGATLDN